MMRSTPNEFSLFGKGTWDYTTNAANINQFWLKGAERARPFESVYTLGMRGFGDCKFVLLFAFQLLCSWTSSATVWNYGRIFTGECDQKPDSDLANCVQYHWCLWDSANLDFVSVSYWYILFLDRSLHFYTDKEVEGYYEDGMRVPDYVTLLWTDDKYVERARFEAVFTDGRSGCNLAGAMFAAFLPYPNVIEREALGFIIMYDVHS